MMAKVIKRPWAAWGLAAALSLAAVTPAAAMSGNEWRQLSEGRRDAFVTGVLEGWGVAVWQDPQGPIQSGSALAKLAGTLDCVTQRRMRLSQVWAIVDDYMRRSPADWHLPMAVLVQRALTEACAR
jgi:hypothetical protein